MTKFQIWWDDFTSSAKKRLKQVYDEKLEVIPITTIEIDDDEDNYFDDDLIY